MIAFLLVISLMQLANSAVLKQSDSMMLGLDDSLGAMLYELPESEDPQMLEYELSQLEDHPIVSLIHLARKHIHNKHMLSKEALSNFRTMLDSVITRLQTVQARLDNGSTDIHVEDIEKSIQDLQTLDHIVRPNIDQLMTAMHKSLSHSELHPQGGPLTVRSRHPPAVEITTSEADIYELIPLTTKSPIHKEKPLAIKLHEIQVHEIKSLATKSPAHNIESIATKPPVYDIEPLVTKQPEYDLKPIATEKPVFELPPPPTTEAPKDISEEEERRAPYKDQVFKKESIQERYEMNPYQSRWTWKTADFKK